MTYQTYLDTQDLDPRMLESKAKGSSAGEGDARVSGITYHTHTSLSFWHFLGSAVIKFHNRKTWRARAYSIKEGY